MISLTWMGRFLALVAVLALATEANAQQFQPRINPAGGLPLGQWNPPKKGGPIIVHPQINGWPGIPASQINPPVFNPGPWFNPAINNPWINQTRVIPVNPFANNPFINNPLAPNPFLLNNQFVNNPFLNNLFAVNNPFVNNPFAPNPFTPVVSYTPPVAIQTPGQLLWRGPDLQVNPQSGLVYRPLTGIARTPDGGTFFRVPGSGLPTFTGAYAPGTGLYFNPEAGTFLNPATGVISRPGMRNIFIPWIP